MNRRVKHWLLIVLGAVFCGQIIWLIWYVPLRSRHMAQEGLYENFANSVQRGKSGLIERRKARFADASNSTCSEQAICTASQVTIRLGAGRSTQSVGYLNKGELVILQDRTPFIETIQGISAPWFKVLNSSGTVGWVFGSFLQEKMPEFPIPTGDDLRRFDGGIGLIAAYRDILLQDCFKIENSMEVDEDIEESLRPVISRTDGIILPPGDFLKVYAAAKIIGGIPESFPIPTDEGPYEESFGDPVNRGMPLQEGTSLMIHRNGNRLESVIYRSIQYSGHGSFQGIILTVRRKPSGAIFLSRSEILLN